MYLAHDFLFYRWFFLIFNFGSKIYIITPFFPLGFIVVSHSVVLFQSNYWAFFSENLQSLIFN